LEDCCTTDEMCQNDQNSNKCFTQSCDLTTNKCKKTPIENCCQADCDCFDNNKCTFDRCGADHRCW
jgi:hypothetical protein